MSDISRKLDSLKIVTTPTPQMTRFQLPIDPASVRHEPANPTEGDAAIREMDGTVLDSRTIKVNEAQDKPRREHHGGPQGGRGGFGGRSGRERR